MGTQHNIIKNFIFCIVFLTASCGKPSLNRYTYVFDYSIIIEELDYPDRLTVKIWTGAIVTERYLNKESDILVLDPVKVDHEDLPGERMIVQSFNYGSHTVTIMLVIQKEDIYAHATHGDTDINTDSALHNLWGLNDTVSPIMLREDIIPLDIDVSDVSKTVTTYVNVAPEIRE